MLQLIYASSEVFKFDDESLTVLLTEARKFNEANSLTGVLLYQKGCFIQVLEGPDAAVMSLYESIEKDPRHTNVNLIAKNEIKEREFGEWSMAFTPVESDTINLEGFIMPDQVPPETQYDESFAKRVLQMFLRVA